MTAAYRNALVKHFQQKYKLLNTRIIISTKLKNKNKIKFLAVISISFRFFRLPSFCIETFFFTKKKCFSNKKLKNFLITKTLKCVNLACQKITRIQKKNNKTKTNFEMFSFEKILRKNSSERKENVYKI